jgi:hypothetical protein
MEQIRPLGGGGQSDVFLVRSQARASERASCLQVCQSSWIPTLKNVVLLPNSFQTGLWSSLLVSCLLFGIRGSSLKLERTLAFDCYGKISGGFWLYSKHLTTSFQ